MLLHPWDSLFKGASFAPLCLPRCSSNPRSALVTHLSARYLPSPFVSQEGARNVRRSNLPRNVRNTRPWWDIIWGGAVEIWGVPLVLLKHSQMVVPLVFHLSAQWTRLINALCPPPATHSTATLQSTSCSFKGVVLRTKPGTRNKLTTQHSKWNSAIAFYLLQSGLGSSLVKNQGVWWPAVINWCSEQSAPLVVKTSDWLLWQCGGQKFEMLAETECVAIL